MTDAELRSRLTRLGLSLKQLSTITGWDYRDLRRMANGRLGITARVADMIDRLERMAADDLTTMEAPADAITIPHFSDPGQAPFVGEGGVMPGSYWHAVAGMLLASRPGTIVVYASDDADE